MLFNDAMLTDDSFDSTPLDEHAQGTKNSSSFGSPGFVAWIIVVGSLVGLWMLGALVFRGINVA